MIKAGSYILTRGATRINSVRFVELESNLIRACVNTDYLLISKKALNTLMASEARSDIERIEITFTESERAEIEKAISDRGDGAGWPASFVFFGEERDYAWTAKAIKSGRPYNLRSV